MGKHKSRRGRVTFDNANVTNRLRSTLPLSVSPIRSPDLSRLIEYEDRRQWHPEGENRPARSFSQSRHRLTVVDKNYRRQVQKNRDRFAGVRRFPSQTRAAVVFKNPDRVLVCVRRNIRREVLHALNKTGRGKGKQRRPRYNVYSKISCRR